MKVVASAQLQATRLVLVSMPITAEYMLVCKFVVYCPSFSEQKPVKWDTTGVAVYFFSRGTEPADIAAGVPQPDTWGAAQARWPAASCDPFKFFNNHHAIFDTTLW
jgi:hypothetical protein